MGNPAEAEILVIAMQALREGRPLTQIQVALLRANPVVMKSRYEELQHKAERDQVRSREYRELERLAALLKPS